MCSLHVYDRLATAPKFLFRIHASVRTVQVVLDLWLAATWQCKNVSAVHKGPDVLPDSGLWTGVAEWVNT